jgi:DNA-binding NarL/FixJ family response regulator
VSNESPQRRTTVCLFSFHPLLPSEFERVLPTEEFRLLLRRIDPDSALEAEGLLVPRASVFVIEAHRRHDATEALAGAIVSHHAGARLLVIAEKFAEETAFPLLRQGAKGLLTYGEVGSQLPRALRVIADAGFWVPRALLSRFVDSTLATTRRPRALPIARRLSRREQQVLELLLENLSNKEIASELHISARTAKFHVSNLLAKHGVRRRADLILLTHTRTEPG